MSRTVNGTMSDRDIAKRVGMSNVAVTAIRNAAERKIAIALDMIAEGASLGEVAFVMQSIPPNSISTPGRAREYGEWQDKLPANNRTACRTYDAMFDGRREAEWNCDSIKKTRSRRSTNT